MPRKTQSVNLPKAPTERNFQAQIIQLARLTGWRVHHTRPAQNRRGKWHTPIQGDAGFPDLVLCKPPRVIFAELKVGTNKPTPAQQGWLDALRNCPVECYLWRPDDWDAIVDTLTR